MFSKMRIKVMIFYSFYLAVVKILVSENVRTSYQILAFQKY